MLTAAGREAHAAAIALYRPLSTQVEDRLGSERAAVDDALLRLREVVDAIRQDRQAD